VPGPLDPSASALVAAAASVSVPVVAPALVEGDEDADVLGEPVGELDGLADRVVPGVADAVPPPAVVEAVVLGAVDPLLVVRVVVDRGAAVVGSGSLVVFVGAGSLVFVGAGGATLGCCPEPKRNPTTVPGAGS
jgi:hypothetical protein